MHSGQQKTLGIKRTPFQMGVDHARLYACNVIFLWLHASSGYVELFECLLRFVYMFVSLPLPLRGFACCQAATVNMNLFFGTWLVKYK